MNIYAIYDRMLKYYQQPFIAQDDKQVLAALSTTVNSKEKNNAIAQAPNHFELWQIGEIRFAEDAYSTAIVQAEQKLIATLDSLLRGSLRETDESANSEIPSPTQPSQGKPDKNYGGKPA